MSVDLNVVNAHRRGRGQDGSVLVEFAISAVLFLTLIFGSITYGVIFWVKASLTHSAGEGARAAIRVAQAQAQTTAHDRAKSVVDGALPSASSGNAGYDVSVPAACPDSPSNTCITVTVTYPYKAHPVIPALPFIPLPDQLKSISVIQLP